MIVDYLYADTFGTHIGKYSKRLRITQGGETLAEAPLLHLKAVYVLERGVSVSSDALAACCERGIPVHYLDGLGRNYASVYAAGLTGTVRTRRCQLKAYDDERGVEFARTIVAAKLYNQATTLKYLAKNRKQSAPDVYQELRCCAAEVLDYLRPLDELPFAHIENIRQALMNIEANGSRRYWRAIRWLIPDTYGWQKRQGRGATDPVNSLLNYGYGILYSRIEQAVVLSGLDPYGGFLHADRPGKPSLVLDLIEEFRQVAVDRVVWGLLNRRFQVEQMRDGQLSEDTRRTYADKILSHLDATMRYEGKRMPIRIIIQQQARHLASFLRGDVEAYEPFEAVY